MQRRVLQQGSLLATAPSAACVARIQRLTRLERPSLEALESFITEQRLDRKAAQALEAATASVQQAVLKSKLYGNTSRACMIEIRAAEAGDYEIRRDV